MASLLLVPPFVSAVSLLVSTNGNVQNGEWSDKDVNQRLCIRWRVSLDCALLTIVRSELVMVEGSIGKMIFVDLELSCL